MRLARRLVSFFAVATFAGCSRATITAPSTVGVPTDSATTAFVEDLSRRTFQWFWDTGNPRNGLVPDRWPTKSFSSVAAVGFGLTAYPIGVERGYITRTQSAERTLTTLRFFYQAPQGAQPAGVTGYKGFFYHFLDMETGHRFETVELSTIDTSLLLMGALFCQQYYDRDTPEERSIRAYADSIYLRVEWKWAQPRPPRVGMGWRPENGFIPSDWVGYNEAMLLYVLALGSPTHPIDPSAWTAWTSDYDWLTFYGQAHVNFAPLFGHQYSHAWIDFRGIQDAYMRGKGIDYFENARRATLSQRAYAIDNPNGWKDYGANIWGLTAADGPLDITLPVNGTPRLFFTYSARGAAANEVRDDGTLAPTAAGGSIPFAPEYAIPALKTMRDTYGANLYTEYGFLDSFNPTFTFDVKPQHGRIVPGVGWFDGDHLGIDQGPILLMLENWRTGLVWRHMRNSPYIKRGLQRAGFTGGWVQ